MIRRRNKAALSRKWLTGFRTRNPGIVARRAQLLDLSRAVTTTSDRIALWHCNFQTLLELVESKKAQVLSIINLDELNFVGNAVHGRTMRAKYLGAAAIPFQYAASEWRESWTWLSAIASTGQVLEPLVVLKNQSLSLPVALSLVWDRKRKQLRKSGIVVGVTPTGSVRFKQWATYLIDVRSLGFLHLCASLLHLFALFAEVTDVRR
jgi:hypothetical protein